LIETIRVRYREETVVELLDSSQVVDSAISDSSEVSRKERGGVRDEK